MALKITTQIGTDKGITSEAYVRISDYQVSKYGSASFRIELFQSESDKAPVGETPTLGGAIARNQQIGENLWVALTKEVDAVRTVNRPVQVVVPAEIAEDGSITNPEHTIVELEEVEETYSKTVPDLSGLESGTIFDFGYAKLKEKLVSLFGAEHVIDC